MKTVFDTFIRTDSEPQSLDETLYQFLNRWADPSADFARARIEERFSVFPEGEAKDRLLGELQAPENDNAFGERLFELEVYHYLLGRGARILGIEVEVSNKKKVDYLIELDGQKLYVEVVTRRDTSAQHIEMDRLDRALRPLRMQRVSAAVQVREEGKKRLEPSDFSAIREQLERGIANHVGEDPWEETVVCHDSVNPNAGGKRSGRWVLRFLCHRRLKVPKYFIGAKFGKARAVHFDKKLLSRLVQKADKYGALEHPLIIVCNVYGPAFRPLEHIVSAAFGGDQFQDIDLSKLPAEVLEHHSIQGHGVFQVATCTKNLHSIIAVESENGLAESPALVHLLNPKYEGPEILLGKNEPTIYAHRTELVGIRGTSVLDEVGVGGYFKAK